MNKKKYRVLLVLCLAGLQIASAQKLPSTTLWRITGNGLQKPSYLFGTMHLTDERIFNIGDSVYKAIEKTDGFATEIDPEQFTPFVIDATKKSAMEAIRLKDMMQKSEFKKYGKILAKKLGKHEDELTAADVLHAKNKWIEESYSNGKMQTFLDVYLLDIARRQGKWTGGVEDLEDQENLLDMVDESDILQLAVNDNEEETAATNKAASFLIKSYIDNNLDAIDSISYSADSAYTDALLVKRNKKMAMRMDSLSKERSMVFAVGAAHLPGDKGLIALLKEKGFSVEPVFSSKKIKPAEYKVAEVERPWYDINDEAGAYTVQMPGKAGTLTMFAVMNMKMYFDVFKSTIYMTAALQTPYTQKMADSVFDNLVTYYFNTNHYSTGKPVSINDVPGREFISTKDRYARGYLLYKDGMMYMAIAVSMKKDTSGAAPINRFLHSFTIHKTGGGAGIYNYVNNIKAYKIDVPGQPKPANDVLNEKETAGINSDLNISTDPATGAYYFFGANEAAKGYFITNDSTTLQSIYITQKQKFENVIKDTMYVKNGCRVLEIGGFMKSTPLMLDARYIFRGNRWYALVALYDSVRGKENAEQFLHSFQTLGYANKEWKTASPDDNEFTTWSPAGFEYIERPGDGDTTFLYESFDSTRADDFEVIVQKFDNYYWQENDAAFWKEVIDKYKESQQGDSVLYEKPVTNGNVKGYEFALQEPGSHNIKRVRKLLNGRKLFSLITVQDAAEIYNDNNNRFFEDFRFNTVQPSDDMFVSKAGVLLNDIASADSATKASARHFLNEAPFTKTDLPLLHKAVLKTYLESGAEDDYDYTRQHIKHTLINFKDSTSYSFAKAQYNAADDTTKTVLLDIMGSFKTREHFDDIKAMLLNNPPHVTPSYTFINSLLDTLQITADIFPSLQPLIKDTAFAPVIVRVASRLLDSGFIDKTFLENYKQDILQVAGRQYQHIKSDSDDYDITVYASLNLLGKMNNPEANAMLQQFSRLENTYPQLEAVAKLLQNKQPVDAGVLKALAADKSQRVELYDTLKAYKKESLFPAQYLSQKSFAESLVYVEAGDDDYPDTLVYLSAKVVDFKGKKARFYFYKVGFGEDEDAANYLGCAGPFSLNEKDVTVKKAGADVYYEEEYDAEAMDELTSALIAQMEEWYEADEK
ncbi:TraB/GumN family protein [Parafilimonas terrae]|uniref:Uncharacterized conserved protein YbaP, TraB family n=1 Tax=Parafilimonas terrae TaxID=1465490 RepID=A0A1I5ZES3_9BACT|nr:TraB/GumN family protein [Parafilimonas terrae]SFQ54915.1 Uncharacterized conserved protein YbaP, TraB family [Parafilimonas terrae]